MELKVTDITSTLMPTPEGDVPLFVVTLVEQDVNEPRQLSSLRYVVTDVNPYVLGDTYTLSLEAVEGA